MRRAGINDLSEFKHKVGSDWMQNHIVDVNTTSAKSFTESVRRRHPKALVINPAPLNVPGWGQLEYLAFWEEIIRTRANAVWFNKDWEFSDGCTLEFVVATQEGLPTYDVDGNLLTQTAAEMAIESAINGLDGFDTEKLHRNLQQLRSPTEQTSSTEMRPLGGTQQHINLKR